MKFLLLLVVLVIAYALWRNARIAAGRDTPRPPAPPPALPQEMVACEVCGLHLPQADAVVGKDGRHFCSQDHRLRAGD